MAGDDTVLVEEDFVFFRGILDKEGWVMGEEGIDLFHLFLRLGLDSKSVGLLGQCWRVANLTLVFSMKTSKPVRTLS